MFVSYQFRVGRVDRETDGFLAISVPTRSSFLLAGERQNMHGRLMPDGLICVSRQSIVDVHVTY
jgi:hypothetical protein